MPTFTSQRPAGIADSFASLMEGNRGLSQTDILNAEKTISGVEHSRASASHQQALAEKVRLEIAAQREADRMRKDPGMATEYGARNAGINLPDARMVEGNFRGDQIEQAGPAPEGGTVAPMTQPMPASVNPAQLGIYNAARAALIGNQVATGKTNAEQLTDAVAKGQQNSIVGAVQTAIANGDVQNASAMNQGAKPGNAIKLFDNVASTGATFAPAIGVVNAAPGTNALLDGTLANVKAQTGQHNAQAGNANASAARTRDAMNREKKGVLQQTDAGLMLVDPITGTAKAVTVDGQPLNQVKPGGKGGAGQGEGGEGGAAHGKAPTGYRWGPEDAAGAPTLLPINGGPAEKLGESQTKQLAGVQSTRNAITEYRAALKDWSKTDMLSPDARAVMGTYYNNMLLQAKEAYNLGVLNGPDYQILQEVVANPINLRNGLISKGALDKQAKELDRLMENIGITVDATGRQRKSTSDNKPELKAKEPAAVDITDTKVVKGVTYVKVGGKWFKQ